MAFQTVISKAIPEAVTAKISATIVDENNIAIALADLTTLTLTLYDQTTGNILNLKTDIDIKNANGGTVNVTTGAMTYTMTPADNAYVGTASTEVHVALIEWTYSTGAKTGRHQVLFLLQNFTKVP